MTLIPFFFTRGSPDKLLSFFFQVDRKEVVYIQTPVESVGWEAMDSMTFSLTSPPASIDSQTFKIDISYENTGPEHNTVLLANTGMYVISSPQAKDV